MESKRACAGFCEFKGDYYYVFGGFDEELEDLGSVEVMHWPSEKWTTVLVKEDIWKPRYNLNALALQKSARILIFGAQYELSC